MSWSVDARIPVSVVADAAGLAAALHATDGVTALLTATSADAPALPAAGTVAAVAGFAPAPPHAAGCACCGGRLPAAAALDRLFQDRVRGRCPWFTRVVV